MHQADIDHFAEEDGWLGDRVRRDFLPLVAAGRVDTITSPGHMLPGISVEETPGHTPGHISVLIESGESQALITGDLTHHPFQSRPECSSAGDADMRRAAATRSRVLARISDTGTLLAAGHYPRPGLGYMVTSDGVRRFVPARPQTVENPVPPQSTR